MSDRSPRSTKGVFSAARVQPLDTEQGRAPASGRLREGAANLGLNLWSMLREMWQDFQRSDRYFKYKAGILASWLGVTALTLALTCPGSELDARNRLGARLVMAGEASRPIYMVVNDSAEPWKEVLVVVNGTYRAAVPRIEPQGNLTLTPKQLIGPNGTLAPINLQLTEMELRTARGSTTLLKDGRIY